MVWYVTKQTIKNLKDFKIHLVFVLFTEFISPRSNKTVLYTELDTISDLEVIKDRLFLTDLF